MGIDPKKYHISDDGKIYRLDDTGEITMLGDVNDLPGGNDAGQAPQATEDAGGVVDGDLCALETRIMSGRGNNLSKDERLFVAVNSKNTAVLDKLLSFAGAQVVIMVIQRFERGEANLEPLLQRFVSQGSIAVQERLANCRRPFTIEAIASGLWSHPDARLRHAYRNNPCCIYRQEQQTAPANNTNKAESNKAKSPKKERGCFVKLLIYILRLVVFAVSLYFLYKSVYH